MLNSRRDFLAHWGKAGVAALAAGCGGRSSIPSRRSPSRGLRRLIVLGVDGMDPQLLQRFLDANRLPNCRRLIEMGGFRRLATSNPPQSPVAWSNFISGTNPGGHGIFDFIARDPETMQPYHSTTRFDPAGHPLRIGRHVLPISPGRIVNQRRGPTFWDDLQSHGVNCTVYRMPANFPPTATEAVTLSGMGTPDIQGGYGTFTFFTDDPNVRSHNVSGGRIERVEFESHSAACSVDGPVNEFTADRERVQVTFTVHRDPERPVAKIVAGGKAIVLGEGEWSDWIPVRFPLLPFAVDAAGICRCYLKKTRNSFGLYVSPVNIDPSEPSIPLSTPARLTRRLAREFGYFHTQGMVEDTHALSAGVLSSEEYRQQALFVHDERMRFYESELARFDEGFLFYYFSTLDLSSHMFWRAIDPGHPVYSPRLAKECGEFLGELYEKVDRAVGQALELMEDDTWLVVMSDHGFNSFRRQFHLNSWLLENGYLRTRPGTPRSGSTLFQGVDWNRTRAYGVGLNGLYLNREGREAHGNVRAAESDRLAAELARRLRAVRDPDTGATVIERVFLASEVYSGPFAADGPDLIVGYNRNYRASWDTILGGFPQGLVLDNRDVWSGDHCVDPQFVPGVLLSSRPLAAATPRLEDLAPTFLSAFGVPRPPGMTGDVLA